nr:hypothetical protein [Tanacetum cinerariifolium]
MKVEESLNATFEETPPPSKTPPLVDDDLVEEEAIEKQTALAISTTEAEYVSVEKACQQALWMKQALVDYGIRKKTTTNTGTCLALGSNRILNDATPRLDAAMKVVSPSVVKETIAMECPVVNTPGKPSGKKVNVRTLFTPKGNGIDVVILVDSIRAISERCANTCYGFFLDAMLENVPWFIRNNPLILKKWHPDENLLKEDVSIVPVWVKLHGVTAFNEDGLSAIATKLGTPLMLDSYTSDMCMQSWGRSTYARVIIELRDGVELKDNIIVVMHKITREDHYTCAGEKKNVKKPSLTSRGVSVGLKIGFKHQKEYRHVTKKPNASSSGNKKKGVEPTIEVSNSNPFDALNFVDNDVKFGISRGTTNLVNNEATSSGSSFTNIDNDGEFAIGEKIDKIERQIREGKLRLLDNDGNLLIPTGIVKSDSEVEVEVVFDETANLRISTSGNDGSCNGYGINSLLEQWRDSYLDNDDYDPHDDDISEAYPGAIKVLRATTFPEFNKTMSSPNHPTSNIENAFSSNFPDYLSASLDYVPASSGKTYSSSSNSFGVVPIASPTLSLFHEDPYMKVLQAFYAEKSPIPPPIITPPSSMPNPQEFFLPKELLSPKKQGHDQSSSSTSTLP